MIVTDGDLLQAVDQQLATDVNLCINVDNILISDASTGRVSPEEIDFSFETYVSIVAHLGHARSQFNVHLICLWGGRGKLIHVVCLHGGNL